MNQTSAQNCPEFIQLKQLINERQVFEATLEKDNQPLPSDVKTDINFSDIHKKTLLDYAAECGDIKTVKDLMHQGAKVTAKAIIHAVNNHRFELADLLYENASSCYEISLLLDLKTELGKEWLVKKIEDDLSKNVDEKSNFAVVSKNSKFLRTEDAADVDDKDPEKNKDPDKLTPLQDDLLRFTTKINNWNYFDYLTTKTKLKISPIALGPLLVLALEYDRFDKAKQIVCLIDALPDSQKNYIKSSALFVSLSAFKAEDKWDYLLANGAMLNTKLADGDTVLAAAIDPECKLAQDIDSIRYLIAKGANITELNYFGQSILHLAAKRGDESIFALIQDLPFPKEFKELRDIFGLTAKDYWQQNQKRHEKDISLGQDILCDKLSYFLKLERCQMNSTWEGGVCNGLSRLFHLYPEDYFYSTLKLINAWDGKIENLFRDFAADLPQSQYYQNLYQLMKAWANHILAFQAIDLPTDLSDLSEGEVIHQYDRIAQHKLLTDETNRLPIFLYKFSDGYVGYDKLVELLNYFYKMPPNVRGDLYDIHSTTLYTSAENTVHYYDSNFEKPVMPVSDKVKFLNLIQNAKFKCYEDLLETPSIPCIMFNIYFHPEDEMHFRNTSFRLLTKDELPKNKQEAYDFQNRSPNHFTPLHIAIIGRDLVMLEQLLKDGYCDSESRDISYYDPLFLAEKSQFVPALELLLKYRALQKQLNQMNNAHEKEQLIKAVQDNQSAAKQMILFSIMDDLVVTHKIANPIYSTVLKNLLAQSHLDQNLFMDIFKKIEMNGNAQEYLFMVLLKAALMNNKIDLNQPVMVKQSTKLFMFSIHKKCYPIFSAIKYGTLELLKSLIERGLNLDVKNDAGVSARNEIRALKIPELTALVENPAHRGLLCNQKT